MTSPLDRTNTDLTHPDAFHSDAEDYRTVTSERLTIHLHMEALDGIARDVVEGFKSLPKRGVEVGGLLLGRKDALGSQNFAEIWIERFQRIPCQHKFGPQYVLDSLDQARLEEAATRITESGDLTVLGTYRSHTRAGFQLEDTDVEFVDHYFGDPSDLVLLVKPESVSDLQAQFFARDTERKMEEAGEQFPFQGRAAGLFHSFDGDLRQEEPDTAKYTTPERPLSSPEAAAPEGTNADDSAVISQEAFRMHRLVPDFVPAGDLPNPRPVFRREMFRTLENMRDPGVSLRRPDSPTDLGPDGDDANEPSLLRKWWPLLGAVALVAGAAALLLWPGHAWNSPERDAANIARPQTEAYRPLGLYVDPGGKRCRITWNQTATPLNGARSVGLFVREGDDQNRIDLPPEDLKSGTYEYDARGNDVTFRLEVMDASGRVSAESFRVIRNSAKTSAPESLAASATGTPRSEAKLPSVPAASRLVPPRAIRRVPPVVAASIRPRIRTAVGIDVRVKVDARGKVTAASPLKKYSGLNAYLAERAVAAARQWRFIPARQDNKPVPGTQTIHFAFDR